MAVSPNPGTEVPCGGRRPSCADRGATANRPAEPLSACPTQFVPALNPLSNMLFQNKAEAPPRTAVVDNAQCHDHVWQLCCRTSPDGQEVGKALVPGLSPARRVGSPSAFSQSRHRAQRGWQRRHPEMLRTHARAFALSVIPGWGIFLRESAPSSRNEIEPNVHVVAHGRRGRRAGRVVTKRPPSAPSPAGKPPSCWPQSEWLRQSPDYGPSALLGSLLRGCQGPTF
jgi:hypothetical protein